MIVFFLAASCKEKTSPYLLRDTVPHDEFTFIDTLKEMAIRNYCSNADTAEYLLDKATHACDSINLHEKKFQILLEKAEFYQYRKPDFLKSLNNLKEAVSIFIKYPGPYAEDPYIYINIGNFFFRTRHYANARSFYHLSFTIAEKITHQHASAISLQNIGLCFEQEGQDDSAKYYFIKAWRTADDVGYLTMAQNFYYLSGQYLKIKRLDSTVMMVDSGFRMINKFNKEKPLDLGTVYPKLLVNSQEIESNLHYRLYQYFRQTNKPETAIMHFENALEHARRFNSNSVLYSLMLGQIFDSSVRAKTSTEEIIADSILYYAKQINDPFKLQLITDTLSHYFSSTGSQVVAEKFAVLNQYHFNNLELLKGSNELFESEILISSADAEQAIQRLNHENADHLRNLKYHKIVTVTIFLVASLIGIALYYFIRLYGKLQNAYSNLTERIKESVYPVEHNKSHNIQAVNESFSEIIQDLEQLMQDKKIYLNPDLTQNELAFLLQTNKTYLSNILKQQFGLNFNDYMNKFRIEEACRIIIDPNIRKLSLDHILEKSGFNSKSTFYVAFKKFTGMSPAMFIKTLHKIDASVAEVA